MEFSEDFNTQLAIGRSRTAMAENAGLDPCSGSWAIFMAASVTGRRQSDGDFSVHAMMRHAPRNETLVRRAFTKPHPLSLMPCGAVSANSK